MAQLPGSVQINIAAVPVRGFGGFCMMVVSILCAMWLPPTRSFILAGVAVGVVCGVLLIVSRRAQQSTRPAGLLLR